MKKRLPSHPGEILLAEFLRPRGITQVAFAAHLGISKVRLNELIRGKRGCTAETAWLLAGALCTSPHFWMNLQMQLDIAKERPAQVDIIQPIRSGFDPRNPDPLRRR